MCMCLNTVHGQANQMNARGAGTCKSGGENGVRSTDTDIFGRINSKPEKRETRNEKEKRM